MCGIVGISITKPGRTLSITQLKEVRKLFTNMFVLAKSRGRAASGILLVKQSVNKKPEAFLLKSPLPSDELVQSEQYNKILENLNNSTFSIIGHTRATSSGSATDNKNNHPHVSGSIVGVHNGCVDDRRIWRTFSAQLEPKTNCDSEAIFALINHKSKKMSFLAAVEHALDDVAGSYALAMVNLKNPSRVYLVKDDRMPLTLCSWEGRLRIFASQENHIDGAFEKVNLPGERRVKTLPENSIVVLDSTKLLENNAFWAEIKKISLMTFLDRRKFLRENADKVAITEGNKARA